MTLDDWTKLLDVALADTQHTCVTLTEVPQAADELRTLISVAQEKAQGNGMALSRLELPESRYGEASQFAGAVGLATDVVRLTFSATAPVVHGRRIVVPSRVQPTARPAKVRSLRHDRRDVGVRRSRDQGSGRASDIR